MDREDPGDETQRNFRYQHAYGVILLIAAITGQKPYVATWYEQHEDFLGERTDGLYDAYQIKSGKPELGEWDLPMRLWELSTGRELPAVDNYYWVNSAALSPDGEMLACASNEQINFLNVKTGQWTDRELADVVEVMSVVFSPDGRTLASINAEHTIKLWELSSGYPVERRRPALDTGAQHLGRGA